MRRLFLLLTLLPLLACAQSLPADLCQGSRRPYPVPDSIVQAPDSLVAIMINHVGRHGARYATSPKRFSDVTDVMTGADLTPYGKKVLASVNNAVNATDGLWGDLDALGETEQRGIAYRLCMAYPQLVVGQDITAISSYVGRCIASMDAFTATLSRFQSGLGSINKQSGEEFNNLVRFFQTDADYVKWAKEKPYQTVLDEFTARTSPGKKLTERLFKTVPDGLDPIKFASDIYYCLSSQAAMGLTDEAMELLTPDEMNRLWETDNLRQYLSRTASTVSTLPADIAAPLLMDLIQTTDDFLDGRSKETVRLRFGHAETLMPLLSLMRLPGCYYLTHYFDTVDRHWQTWNVVPMASNLQMILFRSHETGRIYVRLDLNERPLTVEGMTYIPWTRLRAHLLSLLPA